MQAGMRPGLAYLVERRTVPFRSSEKQLDESVTMDGLIVDDFKRR